MENESALDLRDFVHRWNPRMLLCASCGFEYVHFGSVQIDQATDSYKICNKMTIETGGNPSGVRGSIITLNLWCEQGHRFDLELSFHKGNIFVEAKNIEEIPEKDKLPPELWRD